MALEVDFNNLRKKLCNAFDEVVKCAIECREENGNDDVLGERTLLSMNEDEDDEESPFTICECGRPINECSTMDGGDQHHDRM